MTQPTSRDYIKDIADKLVRHHEGVRTHPYQDTVGKITIGVGRNLTDRGLSVDEINQMFQNDMIIAADILDIWCPSWRGFTANRQAALLSMAFNLGGPRLSDFVKLHQALVAGDFEEAATQALDSRWAKQVGRRADEIARLLRSG
ncbi:MAG: glycoside hydrolase family protein [Candidatus Puniceispirillaceae bacterium]